MDCKRFVEKDVIYGVFDYTTYDLIDVFDEYGEAALYIHEHKGTLVIRPF